MIRRRFSIGAPVQCRTGVLSRLDCVEVAPGDGRSEIIPGIKMGSLDRGLKNVFRSLLGYDCAFRSDLTLWVWKE